MTLDYLEINKKYYSKLLLFGEYVATEGGMSLAIPFERYYGCWKKVGKDSSYIQSMLSLGEYLNGMENEISFNFEEYFNHISEGVQFVSSIPTGYGVGSSGALIAAIYDIFCIGADDINLLQLKEVLGRMESFFHGKSSGVDPLISFINQPCIFRNGEIVNESLQLNSIFDKITLYDSKISRKTEKFVNIYKMKRAKNLITDEGVTQICSINERLIKEILIKNNDETQFKNHFKVMSQLQWQYFQEMIPESVKPLWEKGLTTDEYYMKLCGAGGGGFFYRYNVL